MTQSTYGRPRREFLGHFVRPEDVESDTPADYEPLRAYWAALGVADAIAMLENILESDDLIRRHSDVDDHLAHVAARLGADPAPTTIRCGGQHGLFQYDAERRLFGISICDEMQDEATGWDHHPGWVPTHDEHHGMGRRSVYAHELAHRFFFRQSAGGSYERVINSSTRHLPPNKRAHAFAFVGPVEERICNLVAAHLIGDKIRHFANATSSRVTGDTPRACRNDRPA
jgi:hypothetical protein